MGRQSQSLQCNDTTNPQPNRQQWPVVILAAAATDCPVAKSDNLGATKTMTKTNVRPWQKGDNTGGYNNGDENGPPSSPADGEGNDAAAGNDRGKATAAEDDSGDADAGTSSGVT